MQSWTPGEPGWRNHPPTRERDEHLSRWLWRFLFVLFVAALPAGAYLIQLNECLKVSYQVDGLRAELERIREVERRLRVERARLCSLERVESWALDRRGLVEPPNENVMVVGAEGGTPGVLLAVAPGQETARAGGSDRDREQIGGPARN